MATQILINVSVMNATSNTENLNTIARNLASVENSAFKVATRCAYLIGVEIPCENGAKVKNPKKMERKEVYSKVNKSKATLSRWIKALNYVIEHDLFNDFNNGNYPFSFDKIIMIFDNELITDDRPFADLMKMSVVEIEKLYKNDDETTDETAENTDETTDETAPIIDESPLVTFEYDGKKYTVHESALIGFIENYCELA